MSSPPDPPADDEDGDILRDVYEQYWLHARHVENQVWSYTRMWALVLTGIFTIVGTDLPDDAKAAAALFGALLSLLGFFVVYSLRVPFLAFALRTEALAIREFGLDPGYRRFFENGLDFRDEKGIDIPEILMLVYGTVAAGMVFFATYTWLGFVAALGTAFAVAVVLFLLYLTRIRPKFTEEKRKTYDQFEE
ncbi:hypothetical protein [Haloarchaeobius sp. FL176]|uniref:hypothetical protein n=1 Tax=Haloarchaeobius sp. FL176 TaxID=2967129 RepID=UPI00214823B5|nr:hypothetical protein [Haloarchaeobius sp. FL176]